MMLRSLIALTLVTLAGCGSPPLEEVASADVDAFPTFTALKGFDVVSDRGDVQALLKTEVDEEILLHYIQSDGTHWLDAVRLDQITDATAPSPSSEVHLASRGEQRVAVWNVPGTGLFGSGPMTTAYSHDGGVTWAAGPNPADDGSTGGHAFIDVSAGEDGFHLVWLDSRDGSQGVRYARSTDGGVSWEANQTVDAETCECCWNRVLSDGRDVHVLYRDKDPRDMALASFQDGAWTHVGRVGAFDWNVDGCPHVGGGIVLSPRDEKLHAVVWTGHEDRVGVYYQRSDAEGWTEPHRLGTEMARHSDLAVGSDGRLAAIWDSYETDGYVVYASTSEDDGRTWSGPAKLSRADVSSHHPRVLSTPEGHFIAAWQQSSKDSDDETLTLMTIE